MGIFSTIFLITAIVLIVGNFLRGPIVVMENPKTGQTKKVRRGWRK